ncbi:MAG: outer membrane receptor for ferrienterochelin and colicins [Bacteroidia bacterium]|jgi:outer membrane receptor for ferrienterochelin and colicins
MFVPAVMWGQITIMALDGETSMPLDFGLLAEGAKDDTLKLFSLNGEVTFKSENSQKVAIYAKGYTTQFVVVYPNTKYSIQLQRSYYVIDEAIVTDIHSNKNLNNTVLNISKISAKKIEQLGAVNLQDALAFENNIRIDRDPAIGSSGLTMMGIDGANVKLLIDGVPVIGRLNNQLDLEQFNLENVKQIEVIKGPMSVIYGSNALAGTINIVTNNTNTKPRFNLNTNYETDGQYALTGTASKSFKNHFITLSGGRTMFTGWSANDVDRTFDWIPKEQYTGRVQYSYKHKNAIINVRSELLRSNLLDRGAPLLPYKEAAVDQHYTNQRFDNSLSYSNKIGKSSLQMILGNNNFNRIKNKYYRNLVTLEEVLVAGEAEQDTQTFNASVFRTIYGFDKAKTKGIETLIGFDGNYEIGTGNRIKDDRQEQLDAALFASAEKQLTSYALVRGGIRYAYNSAFESPILYSLQTKFNLPNSQILKVAYGKGFRAPSLKELYLDFNDSRHEVFGDSTLKSETSHSFTASYMQYYSKGKAKMSTTVDGFYNNIENKIELIVTGPIQAKYGNIGKYQSVGGDISQKILYEDFGLNASFNYTGVYNGVEGSKKEFFFSPQVVVNPTYSWKKHNLSANLFFNYFGEVSRVFSNTDSANVNVQEQDAYSMLDFTLNKSFNNKKLRVTLGARNVLGVININANTTEVGAHTPSTNFISISPGRTYFINVRYELFKKD